MLRWRGLPLQLFAFIILPLTALLIGIAIGSIFLHQRSMRQMVGERDERAARAAASAISEQLKHREAAMRSLALRAADLGAPQHVLEDAAYARNDFEGGIALFDGGLNLLATTNALPTWEETAARQHLSLAADLDLFSTFSAPFVDPASGQTYILVSAAALDGTTAVGAFSPAALAWTALSDLFSGGDQAGALLADARGQVLFQVGHTLDPAAEPSALPGVADALRGDSGTLYVTGGSNEQVVAFTTIPPLNWVLVINEPWQAVTDPMLRITEWAPLVLAPVLIASLLGLMIGLQQIIQPLQALEQKAAVLGQGNYAAIEDSVGGIAEIQRLQDGLILMAHKVELAQQSLRGYLSVVTSGQEEERRRLARDLHDDTIQALIALNQKVQLAQLVPAPEPAAVPLPDQLLEMQQLIEQTINDLRRLTRDLRPIYLEDLGLAPALQMLAQDITLSRQVPADFVVAGSERRLSPGEELAFYRIGQEGLNNVVRHAQATRCSLELTYSPQSTTLVVRDNGRGFALPESPSEMAAVGHFGLLGIRERAESIGAQLEIESVPGAGTTLSITLPYKSLLPATT